MENSYQYREMILSSLFVAEHRRLETELVRLHRANKAAWNKQGDGFIYRGEFYIPHGTPRGKRSNLPLHERLHGEGDSFVKDKEFIAADAALISQLLFKLLEPCGYTGQMDQDIRDALPECITDVLPDHVKKLSRMREPPFILNHPRDFRFYEEVLPKLEFYSAARLFY